MSTKQESGQQGGVLVDDRNDIPPLYKVLLHNDDYTTMEFVIAVLQNVFQKSYAESEEIMLSVHQKGIGLCGVYTHEIAETKVAKVTQMAKIESHPLKCTMEKE